MKNNFITGSANIKDIDDEAKKYPIVTKVEKDIKSLLAELKRTNSRFGLLTMCIGGGQGIALIIEAI